MRGRDAFSELHPAVNFLYFALVTVFSMVLMHPVCLVISLAAALGYSAALNGPRGVAAQSRYLVPLALAAMVINAAFNHRGATILCYLPTGNPLTLESIAYGAAAAAMLWAVVAWFSCYTAVMTSDKFVYLFGRAIPALSLVLSMTLRFVPRFRAQFKSVREAQRSVGRDAGRGSPLARLRAGSAILSVLLTWSLENAVETADSMKSRGYGLPGRTAFSIYRWTDRDKLALLWLGAMGVFLASAWAVGGLSAQFYPMIRMAPVSGFTLGVWAGYLALCLTPLIWNSWEGRKWRDSKSGT